MCFGGFVVNDKGLRAFLFFLLVAVVAVRAFYHARSLRNVRKSKFLEGNVNVILRIVAVVSGFGMIALYLIRPTLLAWSELSLPLWTRWIGAALGTFALFALIWIHRALGNNFSGTLHIQEDHQLVTSGPYRWVRHPMYASLYVLTLAFFLLTANWFIGLSWLSVLTAVVVRRVPREEAAMIGHFGDAYRDYTARTGRFLPRI